MTNITHYMSGHLALEHHTPRNSRDRAWYRLTFVPTGTQTFLPIGDAERFIRFRGADHRGAGPYSMDDARQVFNAATELANWSDALARAKDGTAYVDYTDLPSMEA